MKTMTLALLAALALSTSALAAGGGHSHKGPNGGALIDVTGGHAELVDTPTEIALYFSDEDGKPQSAKGASGKATVMSGGKTETLVLSPATPEKLTAPLSQPLAKGDKVVVSAKAADGRSIQGRHVEK